MGRVVLSKKLPVDGIRHIQVQASSEDVCIRTGLVKEVEVTQYGRSSAEDQSLVDVERVGDTIRVSSRLHTGWLGLPWFTAGRMRIDVIVPGDFSGTVEAGSMSGDVVLSDMRAKEISLSSKSGDVAADSVQTGILDMRSASGDVLVRGDCQAGASRLSTVSGDVRAAFAAAGGVEAKSTSGDVRLEIRSAEELTRVEAKSVSGDIQIFVPSATRVYTDMHSVSGRVRTLAQGAGELCFCGDGVPMEAHTTSGSITLRAT